MTKRDTTAITRHIRRRGERWAGLRERSGTCNYISTQPFPVLPDFHDNELLFRSALLPGLDGLVAGRVVVVVVVGVGYRGKEEEEEERTGKRKEKVE